MLSKEVNKAIVYITKAKAYQVADLYRSDSVLDEIQQMFSAELELAWILPSTLSWSHYERLKRLMCMVNEDERDWYMREAITQGSILSTILSLRFI
jgi:hypothetical protein